MSLINNMLKDLEYRERNSPHLAYMPYQRKKPAKAWLKLFLTIGLLVLLFLATMFSAYFLFYKHAKTNMLPFVLDEKKVTNIVNNIMPNWHDTTNITGITVQNKDNLTEITFLLDKNTLYRLSSDEMQNQISIYIDRSKLKSEIPPSNFFGKAISKITSEEVPDATKFTITMAAGSTLKYVNQNTVSGHPELVLAIRENVAQDDTNVSADINEINAKTQANFKSPTMQNMLNEQYQAALINAEHGNYQLATENLNALLKMDPEYKDARVSLVALLIDQGKIKEASSLIEEGLLNNPEFIPYVELKARILAQQGKYKLALSTLETHNPSITENPEYHAFVAAMYEQNDQHKLAVDLYRKLIAINENNSSWWFGLGVSLDKLGQSKNAIFAYKHAAGKGSLNQESRSYLQERLRQLQEAVDDKE